MIQTNIIDIGDPFILVHNNTYYMYSTISRAKDGFKCFSSKNLIDWEDNGFVYSKNDSWGEECFWAPEVYYYNGKFYLLFTAKWKKNHSLRTGLAVSDSPLGPFKDIKDEPLFDLGYATIDATFLFDCDGRNYIYYSRDCGEQIINGVHTSTLYGAEIDKSLTKLLTEPVLISKPDSSYETTDSDTWWWNEGPAVIHMNGRYYLNYSTNAYYSKKYSVCCSESDKPLGPFKKYEDNPILKYKEGEFSGPGHNNFFRSLDGKLMTSFHIHTDYNNPSDNRRFCIAEVLFDEKYKMRIKI